MELTYVDFLITKTETQADGTVIVKGPCTTDDIDSDRQIVDPEFAARGLSKWFSTGANVREMHQAKAIGSGIALEREGNQHILSAHIIEPTAAKLASPHPVTGARVLGAFSVGISGAKLDFTKNPAARGGTIVDGTFVEVSLVDRPANAQCKVDLVTKSENGDAHFTDILEKADDEHEGKEECSTCHGTGKIHEGKMDCPAEGCNDGWVQKRQMDEVGGEKVDRDALDDSDFAGPGRSFPITNQKSVEAAWHLAETGHGSDPDSIKDKIKEIASRKGLTVPSDDNSEKALTLDMIDLFSAELLKGKIPPDDEKVTEALAEATAAQNADNAEHEDGGTEDDEEDDADKSVAPYVVKRLHDFVCAAFHADALKAEYPTVRGYGDVVDPGFWASAVSTALAEDGGTGKYSGEIAGLSKAYGLVVDLVKMDDETATEAHEALHKSFSDAYPSVHLTPSSIAAGQFKRPAITSGRANATAKPGQKPRMPMTANSTDAAHFERGPITNGHEATSPSAGPPNSASSMKVKKFDCVADITETDAGTVIKMIHVPTATAVEGAAGESVDSVWKTLKDEVKGRTFYSNNSRDQATAVMEQMHDYIASTHPNLCPMSTKADDVIEPTEADADKKVPNNADAAPREVKPLDTTTKKIEGTDIEKMVSAAVEKAVSAATEPLIEKLKKTERKLNKAKTQRDELAKMADPELSPFRGGRGVVPSFLKSNADTTTEDSAEQIEVEKQERVEWLVDKIRTTSDNATKHQAMAELEKLASPDEIAEALTA